MYTKISIEPAFGLKPTSIYSIEGNIDGTTKVAAIVNLPLGKLCAVILDGNIITKKLGRICKHENGPIRAAHDAVIESWKL